MSLLPEQILPQTIPIGTLDQSSGNVIIDKNWWLLLYNICENSLGSANNAAPGNNTQLIANTDTDVVDSDAVALSAPIDALKQFMTDIPFIPFPDNPRSLIGLTSAIGTRATYMRSDAAPALSQAIVPTWTGTHTFDKGIVVNGATSTAAVTVNAATGGQGVNITAVNNDYGLVIQAGGTSGESLGMLLLAGSDSSDYAIRCFNTTSAAELMALHGDGGVVLGGSTGGDKGIGTINVADGYYIGGVAINNAGAANPTGTVGLTAVNGSASTFLRSDGAPPLSQAIAPTWTSTHTFSPGSGYAIDANGVSGSYTVVVTGNSSSGNSKGLYVNAGTTSADVTAIFQSYSGSTYFEVRGDGAIGFNGATPAAQSTGWGTPTGGSVQNNYTAGAMATLISTSEALAQIITVLKAYGLLGA